MNFADVQPHSFLDYAWTSPSTPPYQSTSTSSASAGRPYKRQGHTGDDAAARRTQQKVTRKQNRCCDQCRKGKRGCDAAILEDVLLGNDTASSSSNSTSSASASLSGFSAIGEGVKVFHYSDVFGALARCSNCEKTRKDCTFEWLRSQRISQLQAAQHPPQHDDQRQTSPASQAAKKRRTTRPHCSPHRQQEDARLSQIREATDNTSYSPDLSGSMNKAHAMPSLSSGKGLFAGLQQELADWFAEILTDALGYGTLSLFGDARGRKQERSPDEPARDVCVGQSSRRVSPNGTSSPSDNIPGKLENGVLTGTRREGGSRLCDVASQSTPFHSARKRRRHGSTSAMVLTPPASTSPHSSMLSSSKITSSANTLLLTEVLLKIYRESFENHLSCWLTEKTCPVSTHCDVGFLEEQESRPDWSYVYHCVFRLDRLALARGKLPSSYEEKATAKALNLSVLAFASQWVGVARSRTRFPFKSGNDERELEVLNSCESDINGDRLDRVLQTAIWNQARIALAEVEGIESFRVALALIVFSLTQKPCDVANDSRTTQDSSYSPGNSLSQLESELGGAYEPETCGSEGRGVDECNSMMSRLNLIIEEEGPPLYLEKGLRLLHVLKFRMTVAGTVAPDTENAAFKNTCRNSPMRLDEKDKATVDLLFWLAMMFDTLSSAMNKRPLVVSLEDSEFPIAKKESNNQQTYDEFLFNTRTSATSYWSASHKTANSLLCSAAPIKVLLFRKVARLQNLMSRGISGNKIENAVEAALEVYEHWQKTYSLYFEDAFRDSERLPFRVRAWSICLAGHWHLAALLLADLIETIDEAGLGTTSRRHSRSASNFIADFRQKNSQSLADIARCACAREGASPPGFRHTGSMLEHDALMTEPWTVVLIRAFSMASVHLMETTTMDGQYTNSIHCEDNFRQADDCISALWYLGRRSRVASTSAEMLRDVLQQRRGWMVENENCPDSLLGM